MQYPDVFVLGSARTPIGRFGGAFASLSGPELGAPAAIAALERAAVRADEVDEVVFGHARQAGNGPNPARQVGRRAGLPDAVPAFTVNQACASSLKAIILGADAIRLGRARRVLVGGHEAMSRTPYLLERARWGLRMGNAEVVDGMWRDGFYCPLSEQLMGETAETLANESAISRERQDAFALESQQRAARAIKAGRFDEEIVPVSVSVSESKGRADTLVGKDEHPRGSTDLASLRKLSPVFRADGTVTAGNSSGITDGGAALVLGGQAEADEARRRGSAPWARLLDAVVVGVDPARMGIGPVPAVRALFERTGLALDDFGLIELNEAFAAQALACVDELGLDVARVNVNGGAIALGHPIGATGARICVTLLHEMRRRGERRGLATLCVSGGMGVAVAFELLDRSA
ncbi:MAG: thiolase family protein [Thermoanaerobaculia bacterium]